MTQSLTQDDIVAIAKAVADELDIRRADRYRAKFGANPGANGGVSHLPLKERPAKAPGRPVGRPAKSDREYLASVVKAVSTGRPDGLAFKTVNEVRRYLGSNSKRVWDAVRAAHGSELIAMTFCKSRVCQVFTVTEKGREWLASNCE